MIITAVLLFVAAAYFIVLAMTDTYAPKELRYFGDIFGHDIKLFYIRWLIGAILIAVGVWLLI